MNPILLAAIYGGCKGALVPALGARPRFDHRVHVLAPVREEIMYRAAMTELGVHPYISAASFAVDHVLGEQHTLGSAILRIADTVFGALLYQRAYNTMGLAGAIAAHAAHNASVTAGQHVTGRWAR